MRKVLMNYELMRKRWHEAIDMEMDNQIKESRELWLSKGIVLCASEKEYEETK